MVRRLLLCLVVLMSVALPGWAAGEEHHGRTHELIEVDRYTAAWVVIIFVIMLIILYPTAWKGVLEGLRKREERIRKDIADAEAARAKAEATLRDYNAQLATAEGKVREMIASATAQGEKIAAEINARAQKEGEESRARAARDIEAAKDQALTEIYARAAEVSTSIAEKILRRNINVEDQRDLVKQSLEELAGSRR